ncbi:MAG: pilus assembly protein [Alphaproteobacteria bacterium]|nr:pilus assembly protein [Alphaproteobacteria bacterium]
MLRRIARGTSGIAATEFAVALPVLLLMYLGGAQLSDAIGCDRKVTITARAVADLISQNAILSKAQVMSILNASQQIMSPYASNNAKVVVSELWTDNSGNTKVVWSETVNGTARTAGSAITVPNAIKTNNSALIFSEVSYSYTPWVTFDFMRPMTLSQNVYMVPRIANTVSETP